MLSNERPIERVTVVHAIVERLRERILANDLKEGDILRQEALAEAFSVSRMPVREALKELEGEGLVVFHPHRGATVSRLEMGDVEELFDLRMLIECDLIERAAAKATEADWALGEQAIEIMDESYARHDVVKWGKTNWDFHVALYRPAGRERSLALVQNLNVNIDRYVRIQLSLGGSAVDRARHEHRQLLDLYKARKCEEVSASLRQHLIGARDDLIAAFTR